jgi:acyl-coenzyme A synthetase/AMP-(fatty) acid ligase
VLLAAPAPGKQAADGALLDACRKQLPAFMVPQQVQWRDTLPRNPNGKYDRPKLAAELKHLFAAGADK